MASDRTTLIEAAIQIGLIALLALWCFQIAAPFIGPIVWAGIIAIGIYPVFEWLKNKTGMSPGWTSTILTLAMLVVLLTPTMILSGALIDNAQTLSHQIKNDELKIPPPVEGVEEWPLIGPKLDKLWTQASQDPRAVLGRFDTQLKSLSRWLLSTAAGAGLGILVFVFSIIVAGVFLVSAQGAKQAVVSIFNRLAGDRGPELTELSLATVKSVVTGILGIAVIQSTLAGLGFMVMDIPAAGVLAFVCLILAIVQIDILIVLIPLSIYVFSVSSTGVAVAFLVWNIAVGLLNNVLKPILLAKGVDAPMAIIFIGAIGGMMLSGIIGLFVGAVVMVLGYTLFMTWLKEGAEDSTTVSG
ncbi:MAG TPA: AI-2E family transporter [Gammaproteobacteria bacterium]|nr:AI-2E family transporter [Gammaproteobacteria bacterium]